jgi:DNA (cytosine-5)-methyltransferase 1
MIGATLFSGIGAPEIAMPHWRWAWSAEIEKIQSAVLKKRQPNSINLGDVSAQDFTTRAAEIARPDVIVFGSPCQSFSVAGRRLGMDDPRGNLTLTAVGILERLRPRWFVMENVPDLLSSWSGAEECGTEPRSIRETIESSDFAACLGAMDDIRYHVAWAVLDAQFFKLAQRRERLVLVGCDRDWRGPAAVLFDPESLCGDRPARRQAGEGVAGTVSARTSGGGGLGTDFDLGGGLVADGHELAPCLTGSGRGVARVGDPRGQDPVVAVEIAGTVSAKWAKGTGGPAGDECQNLIALAGDNKTGGHRPPGSLVETAESLIAFSAKDSGSDATRDLSPPLRSGSFVNSHAGGGIMPAIAYDLRNGTGSEVAQTLQAGGLGTDRPILLARVRRLTPRECERLQGFEDDYTLIKIGRRWTSDSARYRMLGNTMPVPVMRWVLMRIETVDALLFGGV